MCFSFQSSSKTCDCQLNSLWFNLFPEDSQRLFSGEDRLLLAPPREHGISGPPQQVSMVPRTINEKACHLGINDGKCLRSRLSPRGHVLRAQDFLKFYFWTVLPSSDPKSVILAFSHPTESFYILNNLIITTDFFKVTDIRP